MGPPRGGGGGGGRALGWGGEMQLAPFPPPSTRGRGKVGGGAGGGGVATASSNTPPSLPSNYCRNWIGWEGGLEREDAARPSLHFWFFLKIKNENFWKQGPRLPSPLSLPPPLFKLGDPPFALCSGGIPHVVKRGRVLTSPPQSSRSSIEDEWRGGGRVREGGGYTPPSLHLPPLSISPPPPRLCEGGGVCLTILCLATLTPTVQLEELDGGGGEGGRRSSSLMAPRAMREEDLWRERMGCCGNWREVLLSLRPEGGGEAAIKIIKWSLPRPPSTPRITCREGGGKKGGRGGHFNHKMTTPPSPPPLQFYLTFII
nr:hypothetical protein [Morchella crassipes]